MDTMYAHHPDAMLAAHGFKRTSGRIALLERLAKETKPVTAEYLEKKLTGKIDRGTLYRSLDAFVQARLLDSYDFSHGHAHYELHASKPHHHHAVCENCGMVADVPAQDVPHMNEGALRNAKGFTRITRHSLEFYGLCTSCA